MLSVTQIINEISPFHDSAKKLWVDNVNKELQSQGKSPITYEWLMALSADQGDLIHTYFIWEVMGFPHVPLPDEYSTIQHQINQFRLQYEIVGLACEWTVFKPWAYTGHFDLIVTMLLENGQRVKALCDIKTYQLYRWVLGLPPAPPEEVKELCGNKSKVSLQTSMYREALPFSLPEHWDVTHQFCFHVLPEKIDCVELKYSTKKYTDWLDKKKRLSLI